MEKRVRFGEKVSVEWQNGSPIYLEILDEDGAKVNDLKRNVEQLSVEEISDILGKFGFHDIEKTDISKWVPPKKEFNLDWDQFTMQVKSRGVKYNEYEPTIRASALKLSKDERKRL